MFVQTFRRVSYVTRAVYRIFFSSCADPDWDRTAHISRHTRSHAAPQGRCTRQVCVLTWGRTLGSRAVYTGTLVSMRSRGLPSIPLFVIRYLLHTKGLLALL